MLRLAISSFCLAAFLALATSVWVRPEVPLGRVFWLLTTLVAAIPLLTIVTFSLSPGADSYDIVGLARFIFVFFPLAAGWLLGVLIVLGVRLIRGKRQSWQSP